MQVDALQTELNTMEAENQWLIEDRPDQAVALEAEWEIARSCEENARLATLLEQVKALYEQLLRGNQEAKDKASPVADRRSELKQ